MESTHFNKDLFKKKIDKKVQKVAIFALRKIIEQRTLYTKLYANLYEKISGGNGDRKTGSIRGMRLLSENVSDSNERFFLSLPQKKKEKRVESDTETRSQRMRNEREKGKGKMGTRKSKNN